MNFDLINEFYKTYPPKYIWDDLGIHHEVEVPLPAKYKKIACSCGIIHKWENAQTFHITLIPMLKTQPDIKKFIKQCLTCGEALLLQVV